MVVVVVAVALATFYSVTDAIPSRRDDLDEAENTQQVLVIQLFLEQ